MFQRARPHHQTSTRLVEALSRHPIRFKSTFLHTRQYLFEYVLCHTFSSWKPVLLVFGPNTCRSVYERIVCLRLNCGSDSARMPSSNFLANITVCVAWQTSCGEASNFIKDAIFSARRCSSAKPIQCSISHLTLSILFLLLLSGLIIGRVVLDRFFDVEAHLSCSLIEVMIVELVFSASSC